MTGPRPNMSRAEFARFLGVQKSYVTKLAKQGRLVLTSDGRRVMVRETLEVLDKTRDPNRSDVTVRWANYRDKRQTPDAGSSGPAESGDGLDPEMAAGESFTAARTMRERYAALKARLEYEQMLNQLCRVSDVEALGEDLGITLREALEALPDQLTPMVAPINNEAKVNATIASQIEYILKSLSERFARGLEKINDRTD